MKYFFSLILINLLFFTPTFSQSTFEGTVIFKIEYSDIPEEMLSMKEMLPKKMITKIKGNKTRTEQLSIMGNTITINDDSKKTSTSLINMLDKKIAITMTLAEMETEKAKLGNDAPPQIDYSDDDKEIAGYFCSKANISNEETDDLLTIYYTKEIQSNQTGEPFVGLEGFPMQYQITAQGISMKITATSVVKETIVDSEFEIPKGYTIMTASEFQKSLASQIGQ
jgi:GLPGLI family protein